MLQYASQYGSAKSGCELIWPVREVHLLLTQESASRQDPQNSCENSFGIVIILILEFHMFCVFSTVSVLMAAGHNFFTIVMWFA